MLIGGECIEINEIVILLWNERFKMNLFFNEGKVIAQLKNNVTSRILVDSVNFTDPGFGDSANGGVSGLLGLQLLEKLGSKINRKENDVKENK